MALVADIDSVEGSDDKVLLMTLHSAKGLEFPHVYLAGMEDGLFPGYRTIMSDDPEDVEEERRLAYVGITRAMEDLTLTCARVRMIRGETQYNSVSRFVREIPAALIDSNPASRFIGEIPAALMNSSSASRSVREIPEALMDSSPASRFDREILVPPTDNALQSSFKENDIAAAPVSGSQTITNPRPKAILRPRTTPAADKPFIAKGIDSLNRAAGISKGTPAQATETLDYDTGDRVSHIKYGEGTVLKIDREPRDFKVTVSFDSAGQKIMYASFAKLKRV